MLLKQVSLRNGREPLQVLVPSDFKGQRSPTDDGSKPESEIFLSTQPHLLSVDEIELCQQFIKTLPYRQSIVIGATFISQDDPLLNATQEQLSEVEQQAGLANSRNVPGSGERSIYERVLIIREAGVTGNGFKELASSK